MYVQPKTYCALIFASSTLSDRQVITHTAVTRFLIIHNCVSYIRNCYWYYRGPSLIIYIFLFFILFFFNLSPHITSNLHPAKVHCNC